MGTSLAAESLLSLAVTVTSQQRVESVLQSIVQGLASQPGVALARIWLLPSKPRSGQAFPRNPLKCSCIQRHFAAGWSHRSPEFLSLVKEWEEREKTDRPDRLQNQGRRGFCSFHCVS